MRLPDEVAAMLRLRDLGWGTRRIAAALGCNRETVQRYLAQEGGRRIAFPNGQVFWPSMRHGWRSGSAVTAATLTYCVRSWQPSWA
jgi:hypothetical protein